MTDAIRGIAFPFRIDPFSGSVASQSGDEKLRQNIVHIIMTGIGERAMRRAYGGGMQQLVHDPNNDIMRKVVQHQIAKSLGQLEPRILLTGIQITQDESTLILRISYIVRRTKVAQVLSVPFGIGI